jgi:hypothetical protein
MIRHSIRRLLFAATFAALPAVASDAHLPGELPADKILDGAYPYPPSPAVEVKTDAAGFAAAHLGKVPPPGVHPRILFGPDDLPDLRRRLTETATGRALAATLKKRIAEALRDPKLWGGALYEKLAAGDAAGAQALIDANGGLPPGIGHYQPYLYGIVLEAFDALIAEDAARGRRAGTALATYAGIVGPVVERAGRAPLGDDVWRAKAAGPTTGGKGGDMGIRDAVGYHLLGYGYDFAHGFMAPAERAAVRRVIAAATSGRLWMGARLPRHFRNWNWVAVGLGQPLLALAIEGEEGYDPRVYKLGVEIARDYLTYGISAAGCSTEAVGYTQFGLTWANPFFVAAARRGDNLLAHGHHRAMLGWYLQSMEPSGDAWTSHGDGGDAGPSIPTALMWRRFFPSDSKADRLLQAVLRAGGEGALGGKFHIIEPIVFAADPGPAGDPSGAGLGLPLTWFDPERGSLITRSAWAGDALAFQFECRTDSVGASHEHADRGHFTLFAHGRSWAKDNFRSVETRHHSNVLIDGKGQGYWPGPGRWIGFKENPAALIAACDAKEAYGWTAPKQIVTEPADFVRFKFDRWASYAVEAEKFRAEHGDLKGERDPSPSAVAHWKGFEQGDPRMWDEDGWPVRYPFNPVEKAFRTVLVARGAAPYAVVVDDIRKDGEERLYEWLMQTGANTEIASVKGEDIVLCDGTVKRDAKGAPKPVKGDRLLLVRVLERGEPAKARDYAGRPSDRLEAFERQDTLAPGGRTFGLDRRLVVGSRSAEPRFKILLFPHRHGDPLPATRWNGDRTELALEAGGAKDTLAFAPGADGRTRLRFSRGSETLALDND